MTHAQVAFTNASFTGTGATPAEVRVGLTKVKESELQAVGIDPLSKKNAEGGMAGASCPPFLTYCVCIQHVSRHDRRSRIVVYSTYVLCVLCTYPDRR